MMGEDEHRRVERGLLAPPALPVVVLPRSAMRAELVASHDLGADVAGEVAGEVVVEPARSSGFGAVGPVRRGTRPCEEGSGIGVAERALQALALAGAEPVAGHA